MSLLSVKGLSAAYDGIKALRGVDLEVAEGEMVALIGPNGAGKSTLLNCLSGLVRSQGEIRFAGSPILGREAYRIARHGLLQVPEGRQILPEMTILQNLQVGAIALSGRAPTYTIADVFALFPILEERKALAAGTLSGGQQQMLAIGRALMGAPRLLLLDEPSLGLSPLITGQVFAALQKLNRDGLTVLLVEQNARRALQVTGRAYVIEQGQIIHHGASTDIAANPAVIAHYLGVS